MQFVAVMQDTQLNSASPVIETGSIRAQPLSVNCSAIGAEVFEVPAEPTATQSVVIRHDTLDSSLNCMGCLVVSVDQDLPFHCSASALVAPLVPTAMQFRLAVQETPTSSPSPLVASADHFLPFQCSAIGSPASPVAPTVMQSLAQVHAIPLGMTNAGCLFSAWVVHLLPFHPSPSSLAAFLL